MVMHKDNVIRINENRSSENRPTHADRIKILGSCKKIARKHLTEKIQHMFDNVDDFLFDLADKAETNAQQALYFDAMREIRLQKGFIENEFLKQFSQLYSGSINTISNGNQSSNRHPHFFPDDTHEGLFLVDDDDLEESLAVTNMIQKSFNLFREQLYAVEQRYALLLGTSKLDKNENPAGPSNICNAFRTAAEKLDADIKIKLIVYKIFDRFVIQNIGQLYSEINSHLIHHGILPSIKLKSQKFPASHKHVRQAVTSDNLPDANVPENNTTNIDTTGKNTTEQNTTPQEPGFFTTLQQLLYVSRNNISVGNADISSSSDQTDNFTEASPYQSGDVINALSLLQKETVSKGYIGETIKWNITQEIGKQTGDPVLKQINSADTDAIDIVSMLFDFILDDNHLPDCMKALIGRLQIPILKVSILDKTFFGKKSHPARLLLNELANAEINWEQAEDNINDVLYLKIKQVVETIVTGFDDNIEIFQEMLEDFLEFKQAEEKKCDKSADELLETKIIVAREIGERIVYRIPDSVRCFITEVWKDVLTCIYLRDKKESIDWLSAIQVMDDLIWSIQPKSGKSDQQKLVKIIPNVLDGIKKGLELINYDANEQEVLFQGLQHFHLASLKGEPSSDEGINIEENNTSLEEMDIFEKNDCDIISDDDFYLMKIHDKNTQNREAIDAPLLGSPVNAEQEYFEECLEKSKDIEVGTWVEFSTDPDRRIKGKLVWKSELLDEYTFVDRKYNIVADRSAAQLANDLFNSHACILENRPIFERALEAVVNGLKKCTTSKEPVSS